MHRKFAMWARRAIALATLTAFTLLFLGCAGALTKWFVLLAKWEFVPALLAGNALAAIGILIVTLLAGRIYCGMCCPLGILQDVAWRLLPRKGAGCGKTKAQLAVRLAVLAAALAVGLAGLGYSWLEPYGIFGRGVSAASLNMPGWAKASQLGLIGAIFILALWKGRVWCNWICPVGTLLGIFSVRAPFGLKIDSAKCIGCKKCERSCRAGAIAIEGKGGKIDLTKCVQCRDCTVLCPKGAIGCKGSGRAAPEAKAADEGSATLTRREFIVGSSAVGASFAAKAVEEKIFDGGFADVSDPGIDRRDSSLKPAGALSIRNFREKCVGCQLCVQSCPNHVLRPSLRLGDFMQPEMAFDKGFCTPDCTRCSQVCPAGAIVAMSPELKLHTHIGAAVWHKDRCIAATEGVNCTACFRHCPVKAIKRVRNENGVNVPVVDSFACIGCGACEHVCPARPLPGMTVKAFEKHISFSKMGDKDAIAEAVSLLENDGKACVLVKDGVFAAIKDGRGVAPLLEILDAEPDKLRDAILVDKVIGRAAAAICALGGVKHVYGLVVSDEGAAFLAEHGIGCSARESVPRILNRDKSDICPLEKSCEGLSDPSQMAAALRAKIAELRK